MSYTLEIGKTAPDFSLIGTDGLIHTLNEFRGSRGIVVFFTCNHCPYVIGSEDYLISLAKEYYQRGIAFVAINSNSPNTYEEDSFENMVIRANEKNFPWPYLQDRSQQIAKRYGALCTPHFFLFDQHRQLIYTGCALDNPREPARSSCDHLRTAIMELLDTKPVLNPITDPIGCNIKWEGKDPHWMPEEACSLIYS